MSNKCRRILFALVVSAGSVRAQSQLPTKVSLCNERQLTATFDGGAAMGSDYINITVRNISKLACLLGRPRLEQLDSAGLVMKPAVHWPVAVHDGEMGKSSAPLEPAQSATFVVETVNRTGYTSKTHCGSKIRIYLRSSKKPLATIPAESCAEVNVSGYIIRLDLRSHLCPHNTDQGLAV